MTLLQNFFQPFASNSSSTLPEGLFFQIYLFRFQGNLKVSFFRFFSDFDFLFPFLFVLVSFSLCFFMFFYLASRNYLIDENSRQKMTKQFSYLYLFLFNKKKEVDQILRSGSISENSSTRAKGVPKWPLKIYDLEFSFYADFKFCPKGNTKVWSHIYVSYSTKK